MLQWTRLQPQAQSSQQWCLLTAEWEPTKYKEDKYREDTTKNTRAKE